MDDAKINSGFLDGLGKSKKLGLTTTFVTTCFTTLAFTANPNLQLALVSAAVLSVVAYLVSQSIVEAAWGHSAAEGEEDPVEIPAASPVLPATTSTLSAK